MIQRPFVTVLSGVLAAASTRTSWATRFGDAVVVGRSVDGPAVRAGLDACPVGSSDPAASDPAGHRGAPDPFPA